MGMLLDTPLSAGQYPQQVLTHNITKNEGKDQVYIHYTLCIISNLNPIFSEIFKTAFLFVYNLLLHITLWCV